MKIERVRTAVIQGNFPWVLVSIDTDAGITGLGEAYWGAGVAELVHQAKPLLIGEDPRNINKLVEIMIRCLSGEGSQAGATVTAISGIEIALWDLLGRALETPISTLFGGHFRDSIRIYADCHAGATPDPADYAKRASEVVAAGFTAIKFDLDTRNPFTLDISDDPHPRRHWFEPFNRTIGSASWPGWSMSCAPCARRSGPRSWSRWTRTGSSASTTRSSSPRRSSPSTCSGSKTLCRPRTSRPSATSPTARARRSAPARTSTASMAFAS